MSNSKIAIRNISRHKSRSFLTILGIAVGIALVLSLGGISEGLSAQIQEQFASMAAVITVSASDRDEGVSQDDIEGIKSITGVIGVIPTSEYSITRSFGGRDLGGMMGRSMAPQMTSMPMMGGGGGMFSSLTFTAIDPEELDTLIGDEVIATEGRKLEDSDSGEMGVLLGATMAENQALNVGDEIEYERTIEDNDTDSENDETESFYFDVIGILEETGTSDIDSAAYVSLATMQDIEDDDTIQTLIVKVADVDQVETLTDKINDDFEDVSARSTITMVRQIESSLASIQLALLAIGAVAVIVGGIGITNTMIMSVMERRRDMGIMKALGATRGMILKQVLQEALMLSIIGGVAGIIMSYLGASAMSSLTGMNSIITPYLLILGIGFALALGIGSGIYPALQASKLDPIEVLRYE